MRPGSESELHFVPDIPEIRRQQNIFTDTGIGFFPPFDHRLNCGKFPRRVTLAGDFQIDSIQHSCKRNQLSDCFGNPLGFIRQVIDHPFQTLEFRQLLDIVPRK